MGTQEQEASVQLLCGQTVSLSDIPESVAFSETSPGLSADLSLRKSELSRAQEPHPVLSCVAWARTGNPDIYLIQMNTQTERC